MSLLDALIYGFLQGLTEFLPVSSSAHLALLPHILSIPDPGVSFDLLVHGGTALSVIVYFRQVLITRIRNWFWQFVCATIVTAVIALAGLKDFAPVAGREPVVMAATLALFGILLYLADRYARKKAVADSKVSLTPLKSLIIGAAQALALFPGVSRSGVTLTAARFMKIPLKESAEFTFILSLAPILGGIVLKWKDFNQETFPSFEISIIAIITSFLSGLIAIRILVHFLDNNKIKYFAIYRILLAGMILIYLAK